MKGENNVQKGGEGGGVSPHNYYFTFRIDGWWRKVRSIIHHWTERAARGESSVSSDQKASLHWRVRIKNDDGQGPVFFTSLFCCSQIKYFFIPFKGKRLNPHFLFFFFFFLNMPQGGIPFLLYFLNLFIRMNLWWSFCTLCLPACQVRGPVLGRPEF